MIQWKTVEPDASPRDLRQFLGGFALLDVLATIQSLSNGPLVLFTMEAKRTIGDHVSKRREESGGLLLGFAATPGTLADLLPHPVICVTDAVPCEEYQGTSVSLHMDPSVWTSARPMQQAGLLVVGWFHSHPNLGAFFSGTDRDTQKKFFPHEYSLGYVIDPYRDEHAYFVGAESNAVDAETVIIIEDKAAIVAAMQC